MALFQPDRNPTPRDLRWFAGLWLPALCVGGGVWLMRHQHPGLAEALWIAGAIQSIAGLVAPATIRPVYRFLMRATFPIGWLISHIVVASAYFLVITPIGLVMRLWHDPMRRTFERSTRSYWLDARPVDRARYFRQM